jgi:Ribbon-helix-helix protein, copG family
MVAMVKPLPRKPARGPTPKPAEEIRSNRLTLRTHDDLMELLSLRAREQGVSRSAYIERLLTAWLRADPRNPKIDNMGRLSVGAPEPRQLRAKDPMRTAEQWTRYAQAHEIVFGHPPPRTWLDDLDMYWPVASAGPYDDPTDDAAESTAPSKSARKKR